MKSNADALEKINKSNSENQKKFERLKKIQKVLGQAGKRTPTYNSIPNKVSELSQVGCQKNVAEQIKQLEKQILCKSIVNDLISEIVEKDPLAMSKEVVESLVRKVELRLKRSANARKLKSNGNRLKVFQDCNNTWLERSVVMFFFLHDFLGAKNNATTSKAFKVLRTTISTWFNNNKYWGNFVPFLNDLNVEEVVQCIKDEELKAVFVEAIEGMSGQSYGKLDLDKFKTWKPSATLFTGTAGKNNQKQTISTQKKIALARAEKGKIQFLKKTAKRIGKGRNLSFPVPARFVVDEVVGRWERGNPPTYQELYLKTSKQFNDDPSHVLFKKRYLGEKKRNKFST